MENPHIPVNELYGTEQIESIPDLSTIGPLQTAAYSQFASAIITTTPL